MKQQESTRAGMIVAVLGIGVSIATGFAVSEWLGVVAGTAALAVAYLASLIVGRMARAERATTDLAAQVAQLEAAIASQIQARMSAEEQARAANLRAADAALPSSLSRKLVAVDSPTAPLVDETTGLYGEGYFLATVEQRINAARRHLRPVAVGLLEVIVDPKADPMVHVDPTVVTAALSETLRDADTACRLGDGRFAIILEDTPENGAIWTIERLRRQVSDAVEKSTMWAGVACYPAHGFDSTEILAQAEQALTAARDWPQDRIEVAETR